MSVIYCVEDDAGIRELVSYALTSSGFETECFEEGESFLQSFYKKKPDLVLLDVMLPGMDGMEILKAQGNQAHKPYACYYAYGKIRQNG